MRLGDTLLLWGNQARQTNKCRIMTEEDTLLLDHKKREVKRRDIRRDDFYCLEGTWISTDNYLMTDKKGNGCKKRLLHCEKSMDYDLSNILSPLYNF